MLDGVRSVEGHFVVLDRDGLGRRKLPQRR